MPKKRQGGGGSKQPTTNAEESYIVFSNARDEPKSKAGNGSGKAQTDANGTKQAEVGEAPKKPDTRALIGGASWTGKLPVNILAELCQKQKWEKPEYTMVTRNSYPLYY